MAGALSLDTCGSAIDTVLTVYDACGGLELACNDDATGVPCSGTASALTQNLAAGQAVWVRVSDKGVPGTFVLHSFFDVPPPSNDDCAFAEVIVGSGLLAFDTTTATPVLASGLVTICAGVSKDIWYESTSPSTGDVTAPLCSGPGSYDSVITIYGVPCPTSTLDEIACNDDGCGGVGVPMPYCTAGVSINGCVPTIAASGAPSASALSGFVVTVSSLDGDRNGLLYYTVNGPASTPFGAGFLCVASPRSRLIPNTSTGGNAGLCDRSLSADVNVFAATHPTALGVPFQAGTVLNLQGTCRDPGSPRNRVMSDALQVTLLP